MSRSDSGLTECDGACLKILVRRDRFGNIHYPLRRLLLLPAELELDTRHNNYQTALIVLPSGRDAGQGREAVPIVEDVRVYGRRYAAAFSLAA